MQGHRSRCGTSRRGFLRGAVGAASMLGGTGLGFLAQLRPVSADEAKLPTSLVRLGNGIEPTVRLLEETPREKLLEEVAARIKGGLSYRELLAALQLAGVRNVQPRPAVGFKFHAVLVINSAHLASLASPDSDRWLPIFWALDRFKSAQAETAKGTGWRMGAVDESKVPPADKARGAFVRAMDEWNEEEADAAAAALARSAGRNEAFELFARYGARDFRDIGHKAIYVANSFRTLECIGWQHAEPVLRSLAYALLKREKENPAKADLAPDRPWRLNVELVKKVRADWPNGKPSKEATAALISTFRTASDQEACEAIVKTINEGVAVSSVWDAVLAASGELLMRKPGIVALHSVTSSNALRFAYESSADAQTRLLMLLQNAAFVPLFRTDGGIADKPAGVRVNEFEPAPPTATDGAAALDEIFTDAGKDRLTAARKALAYLDKSGNAHDLMHAARRLVFLKGNDAHDYKFSSAVLEDYAHVSPAWRNRYLAASLFYLPSSTAKDNPLVRRTRAALAALAG
jgi:hypothetical protein